MRSPTRWQTRVLLTLSILSLAGCSELSKNAERSADNSQRAADNSSSLLQLNDQAYLDGRQAGARDRRSKELQNLERAKTIKTKILAACAYVMAFEFQLWKGDQFHEETYALRETLKTEAVIEFFRSLKDYLPAERIFDLKSNDPAMPNLIAIAMSLHRISNRQEEVSTKHGFAKVSLLDLIVEGLSAKTAVESGKTSLEALPGHVYEVLKEEQDAVYLLQLRYNVLAGSVIEAVATPQAVGPLLKKEKNSWHADFSSVSSVAQTQAMIDQLKLGLQTRGYLLQAGQAAALDPKLGMLAATLDPAVTQNSGEESSPRSKKARELVDLLRAALGGK